MPKSIQPISRAERTALVATRLARQMAQLARNIEGLDAADYIAHKDKILALVAVSAEILSLATRFESLKTQSRDVSTSADDLVNYTADGVMVEDQREQMETIAYIAWGRLTARLRPALFYVGLKETLTHPDGRAALDALRLAIEAQT